MTNDHDYALVTMLRGDTILYFYECDTCGMKGQMTVDPEIATLRAEQHAKWHLKKLKRKNGEQQ